MFDLDNQIINILSKNEKIFQEVMSPLLIEIDETLISREEKVNILRSSYSTYSTIVKDWKNLYIEIDQLNQKKKQELINKHFEFKVMSEKEKISKSNLVIYRIQENTLQAMLPEYKRASKHFVERLFDSPLYNSFYKSRKSIEHLINMNKSMCYISQTMKIEHELECEFYKYKFGIAIIKLFAVIEFVEFIKTNEELLYLFERAIEKYKNSYSMSNEFYGLFLTYTNLNISNFSKENFREFLNILPCWDGFSSSLFANKNVDNHFIYSNLSTKEFVECLPKEFNNTSVQEFAKTIFHKKCFLCNSLEELLLNLYNIPKNVEKIKSYVLRQELLKPKEQNIISIVDIDLMSGAEFEEFLCNYFKDIGYKCEQTKATGDQGVDLIAIKDDARIAIQAKCYSGVVGNHAIMEVFAGAKYYNANKCMVITNSTFTKSAIELARSNGVILWDRQVLIEKLSQM